MQILIAGASGAIGHLLVEALKKDHQITVLGRDNLEVRKQFNPPIDTISWQELSRLNASDYQVVINLCGKNIAQQRWTAAIKDEIINSRVKTNQDLIQWILKHNAKPAYYCAGAVGFYGIQSENDPKAYTEEDLVHSPAKDFLQEIGLQWEQSLEPAITAGIPVTITRFGVVLDSRSGMLQKLAPAFKFGMGSILGSGNQVITWIDRQDLVRAFEFLLSHPEITGPVNITAPNPITQKEFATTFASLLQRPLFIKLPKSVVKLIFGEMGELLLLSGQRVLPKRLLAARFNFNYPTIESSLKHLYKQ